MTLEDQFKEMENGGPENGGAIFSARKHVCYSALYAIARPSMPIRPSVRLSVTRVDKSKTVEFRIM